MKVLRGWIRPTSVLLVFVTVGFHFPMGVAKAEMIGTRRALNPGESQSARDRVRMVLDREDVRAQMESLGVSPEETKARIESLSDQEVAQIAGRLDELPAGGQVGAIVAAIVIIFLVLLVTDIMGWTDVFPFVKKHKSS
ncbi:MAG: PA2779 family protein [Nitrospinota bacterium]